MWIWIQIQTLPLFSYMLSKPLEWGVNGDLAKRLWRQSEAPHTAGPCRGLVQHLLLGQVSRAWWPRRLREAVWEEGLCERRWGQMAPGRGEESRLKRALQLWPRPAGPQEKPPCFPSLE